jgi:hypothetical protein
MRDEVWRSSSGESFIGWGHRGTSNLGPREPPGSSLETVACEFSGDPKVLALGVLCIGYNICLNRHSRTVM